ncbi:MAG: CRISPR-associated endoribonuclease Cas6 [Bacteroidota bacterium]
MRVRIIFQLKNRGAYVPFHHQYLLAQTIRGVLARGGNREFLNSEGYNFSGLKGQTRISRKGLHFFSARVTLVFSAATREFLDHFSGLLLQMKELQVGNMLLQPERIEPETVPALTESGKFLCISPMVLLPGVFQDETGKRFISPDTDEFSDLLYEQTMARMAASGRFSESALKEFYRFQLVPDRDYLSKLEENNKKFSRIYPMFDSDIRYEVRGYTFPFTLFAAPPVQQFVYEHGLGQLSHKGFGMLDLAGHHPVIQDSEQELQQYA